MSTQYRITKTIDGLKHSQVHRYHLLGGNEQCLGYASIEIANLQNHKLEEMWMIADDFDSSDWEHFVSKFESYSGFPSSGDQEVASGYASYDKVALIDWLFVHHEHRNEGLSKVFMDLIYKDLPEVGVFFAKAFPLCRAGFLKHLEGEPELLNNGLDDDRFKAMLELRPDKGDLSVGELTDIYKKMGFTVDYSNENSSFVFIEPHLNT